MHTVIYEKRKHVIKRVLFYGHCRWKEFSTTSTYLYEQNGKPTNDYYLPAVTAGWGR